MFKEFKEFAMRGNVVDMAVGVVMGAAFGVIVTSLVNDLLMPVLGLLLGDADFTNLFIVKLTFYKQMDFFQRSSLSLSLLKYPLRRLNPGRLFHHT